MNRQILHSNCQELWEYRKNLKECKDDALTKLRFMSMQSDTKISRSNKLVLREIESLLMKIKI